MVLPIDLLQYKSLLKIDQQKKLIFDLIRRKNLVLTPEEIVRQLLICFLMHKYYIPSNLIAVEKQILLNNRIKRFDILVYDKKSNPIILIECKRFDVKLNQKFLDQVSRYNIILNAPFAMVTNGNELILLEIQDGKSVFHEKLPEDSFWLQNYY